MRDFKNMKRQRGRNNRGGGGGGNGGGNGGRPQQNANRAFDSNGPDNVKIRGHAQHVFEKYQQLARDAFSSGDRVLAENYLQHADHYFRVLRAIQPQRLPAEILGRDVFASGLDLDFEEDFDGEDGGDLPAGSDTGDANGEGSRVEPREPNQRDYAAQREYGSPRDNGVRDNGVRDGGQRDNAQRDGAPREGGQRDGGRREDRFEGRQDRGEPRQGGFQEREGRIDARDGRGANRRFEGRRDNRFDDRREGRQDVDPLAVTTPEPAPAPMAAPASLSLAPLEPIAAAGSEASMLRSEDGGVSHAPAFLQAPMGGEDGEGRRPRTRRRRPRSFETDEGGEGGEGSAAASSEPETA